MSLNCHLDQTVVLIGHQLVQKHKVVRVESPAMADLVQLLGICNVCQIVTDQDIRSLEEISQRLGIVSLRESSMNSKQVCYAERKAKLTILNIIG
jgi:hypothetical protein